MPILVDERHHPVVSTDFVRSDVQVISTLDCPIHETDYLLLKDNGTILFFVKILDHLAQDMLQFYLALLADRCSRFSNFYVM